MIRSFRTNADRHPYGAWPGEDSFVYSDTSRILFILWMPLKADWPVSISSLLAKGPRESFS